jgi:hypothetical protein
MSRHHAGLFASFLLLATTSRAAGSEDYAGQYVLRLGARNFIVVNLRQMNGALTGTLSRPHHSSLGAFFTNISADVITEPISAAHVEKDHLHFVASNPADASDRDAFDLTLLTPAQASLQSSDIAIDPWKLDRVPVSPALPVATDWDSSRAYYTDETQRSNPEMQRIMDEDQKPRQSLNMSQADWATINKQDEGRRKAVRELLAQDALHTGKDFEQAAFVFQHGGTSDDYLLAHTLAMIAVARGNAGALWIATATLDRYLKSIKQPQIYGTQFNFTKGTPWTQEPYDRSLISDDLRRRLGVPSQAAQQKQLEKYKAANH